jgi:hypothetical protein
MVTKEPEYASAQKLQLVACGPSYEIIGRHNNQKIRRTPLTSPTLDTTTPTLPRVRFRFATNFAAILGGFFLLVLASLPIFLSFDLWLFEDRASFLHLDELVAKHHRLGVDVFYSYGLLPVLLQHLVFVPFGRSFRPMIGCTLLVLVLNALFWAALLEYLPAQRRWLLAVVALSQIILAVNPVWPYSLAVLSMMFALLFVLKNRLDIAFAISAIGCFCVPSLTLVLTGLIFLLIVADWWLAPGRSFASLAALLLPGVLTYSAFAVLLGFIYGLPSLVATALPLSGARFYKEIGYTGFEAFLTFLHPAGYSLKYYIAYYIGSSVTWFCLCSLFLFGLTIYLIRSVLKGNRPTAAANFVILYSIVQFIFIFVVYGSRGQHGIYEGLLASATLVGISVLPQARQRNIALILFLAAGTLGETGAVYKAITAWRTTARSPESFGLYADPGFMKELSEVVQLSQHHRTLMLGYATGISNYYPSLEEPDAWFLQRGQLFPAQKQAIVDQINHADAVVEVLTSQSEAVNGDPNIQAALNNMEPTSPKIDFRIRMRKEVH